MNSELMPWEGSINQPWNCRSCGFACPWWQGCERFSYCTTCDGEKRRAERLATIQDRESDPHVFAPGYIRIGKPQLIRETQKALLFALPSGGNHWIPKSLLVVESNGTIAVRAWFYANQIVEHGIQAT